MCLQQNVSLHITEFENAKSTENRSIVWNLEGLVEVLDADARFEILCHFLVEVWVHFSTIHLHISFLRNKYNL